jgi:hypoxanthine phosphoribosyltransferase
MAIQKLQEPTPNDGWVPIRLRDGKRPVTLTARNRALKTVCLASSKEVEHDVEMFVRNVLNEKLAGKKVTIIPILEGSMIFATDILKNLNEAAEVHVRSVKAAYYGERETPGETPVVLGDPFRPNEFRGRVCCIVDDVHDSGETIAQILALLKNAGPEAVLVVVLVNKIKPKSHVEPDYWIYECESNVWLGGHGMDFTIDEEGDLPKVVGVFRQRLGLFDKHCENYDPKTWRKFR